MLHLHSFPSSAEPELKASFVPYTLNISLPSHFSHGRYFALKNTFSGMEGAALFGTRLRQLSTRLGGFCFGKLVVRQSKQNNQSHQACNQKDIAFIQMPSTMGAIQQVGACVGS